MKKDSKITVSTSGAYANTYYYGTLSGTSFSVSGNYGCREQFLNAVLYSKEKNKSYVFAMGVKRGITIEDFRQFIYDFEKTIAGIATPKIHVNETTDKSLFIFEVDNWWLKSKIRREFLTIMLRAMNTWYKSKDQKPYKDVYEVLLTQPYFKRTEAAMRKFMDGYNMMDKGRRNRGWVNNFSGQIDPDRWMIKPRTEREINGVME